MIRWGILGAANIARKHVLSAIQTADNSRVLAVASRDPGRAEAMASEFGLPRVHARYADLLADPEIDAVYIPLPNSEHRHWALEAAAAGKHILCEKPLATSAEEAQEMVETAVRAGVVLAEAFMYRFHPRVERLLALIHAGAIGQVRLIRSTFTFGPIEPGNIRLNAALGGGALMDVGCYCVNFARLVTGKEPTAVSAQAIYGSTNGVDETFGGVLHFGDAALSVFDCSVMTPGGPAWEVLGTGGTIAAPHGFRPVAGRQSELHLTRNGATETLFFEPVDEYRLMVEDFVSAIQHGRPVRFDPQDGVANMRVLDELRRQAKQYADPG